MLGLVITIGVGATAGIFLSKYILTKMKEKGDLSLSETLRACFGQPMSATEFTFTEVRDWIKAQRDKLVDGTKAVVMKVNEDTMKSLGIDFDAQGLENENYLVLVIMTADRNISDSLLVKYGKLDKELENVLAKGNGTLVVKG